MSEKKETYEVVDVNEYFKEKPCAQCTECGRKTWTEKEVNKICGMSQPDGMRCSGRMWPPANR